MHGLLLLARSRCRSDGLATVEGMSASRPGGTNPAALEIEDHYAATDEAGRLAKPRGSVEFLRTMEILSRFLPPPPARLLDVGGGPGRYALALEEVGYDVHLLDLLEEHVAQAHAAGVSQASVGDARDLQFRGLFGGRRSSSRPALPLDRSIGPRAGLGRGGTGGAPRRGCRRRGYFAFASLIDGLNIGLMTDPDFVAIVEEDLRSGQHRNPEQRERWFTTAYFHHPDELVSEMAEAGLEPELVAAVEGPAQTMGAALDEWLADPLLRETLLASLAKVESEPTIIGSTGHLLAIGRR